MNNLEILTLANAIHIEKENQTVVDYYLFDEFEIHINTIPPHSIQEWHYHSNIEETLVILDGELTTWWKEDEVRKTIVKKDEVIRVKQSIHTFSNESNEPVKFIVFRFVPDGINKREIIKNDKTIIEGE